MRAPITDKHLLEMMWERFPEIMQRGAEQPAQHEPVAWISTGPARMIHWTSDIPAYGDDWIPLYTSPPAQRQARSADTWVGLSDLNIDELENKYMKSAQTAHQFLRAIEAKLKEKNNGN